MRGYHRELRHCVGIEIFAKNQIINQWLGRRLSADALLFRAKLFLRTAVKFSSDSSVRPSAICYVLNYMYSRIEKERRSTVL